MDDRLSKHFAALFPGIKSGRVVPLLGAGASAYARERGSVWKPESTFPPFGRELAAYLANKYAYPYEEGDQDPDLFRLAQYISIVAGRRALYDELRQLLDRDLDLTNVHRLIASLPALLREEGHPNPSQFVVTTNYDDCIERAFHVAGEPVDVVWYVADGHDKGKFLHRIYQGEVRPIENVAEYRHITLGQRSLVLKLHGSVDRFDRDRDSYVITLDDYLEYLIRADVSTLLPPDLVEKLYGSSFLFLGYGMSDWNLQVILHRIWGEQRIRTRSWAVQPWVGEVNRLLWAERDVDLIEADLEDYVNEVETRLRQSGSHIV